MSRSVSRLATSAMACCAAWCSARDAARREVGPAEERVFRTINGAPDHLHLPVWAVMQAGSLAAVFAVSAAMARRGPAARRPARITATTGTAVWAGVKVVKPLIGRGRPEDHLADVRVRGHAQSGLGYPSGHAAVSLGLALSATHGRAPIERRTAIAVAAATGCARVYVGAHLPLDVVGGFAIGVLTGRLAELLIDADPRGRVR